jgi:hypothetical protein
MPLISVKKATLDCPFSPGSSPQTAHLLEGHLRDRRRDGRLHGAGDVLRRRRHARAPGALATGLDAADISLSLVGSGT